MAFSINLNGVSHVTEALPILDEVNQEIISDSEDRAFWWDAMAGTLATLLQANQYSDEAQRHYLRWFSKWVPPALGPRPINGKPYYGSWLTHDLSPFEFSINWKEKSRKQIIRFSFEPTTKQAGTASDPINQLGAKRVYEHNLERGAGSGSNTIQSVPRGHQRTQRWRGQCHRKAPTELPPVPRRRRLRPGALRRPHGQIILPAALARASEREPGQHYRRRRGPGVQRARWVVV